MSTVVSFMPMNLRLFDSEVRELRTYYSPLFSCVERSGDRRGLSTHIAADNGGGKSTLLLFFELLFCKPGNRFPNVGGKSVIDYLRRVSAELHDTTPTTMAALVRKDDASIMERERDTIFGYTVGLRGDGAALDLRRFVIPLKARPDLTLERLARDYVFDASGAPRPIREVRDRLVALDGCQLYGSSDWEGYVERMAEAGISPILWRELAHMNASEEAAETYFRTNKAFDDIVGLIQEAQQPTSGERAKPLWDTAVDVARQVSTQEQDRARRAVAEEATLRVGELAGSVREIAEARESLAVLEREANAASEFLGERARVLQSELDALRERQETYTQRRAENERLHASQCVVQATDELARFQAEADARQKEYERRKSSADAAGLDLALDDAAASYQRHRSLEAEVRAKRDEIAAIEGRIDQDEYRRRATKRAWDKLARARRSSQARLEDAKDMLEQAKRNLSLAKRRREDTYARLRDCERTMGSTQTRWESALGHLQDQAATIGDLGEVQATLDGLYLRETLERLDRTARHDESVARKRQEASTKDHAEAEERVTNAQAKMIQAKLAQVEADQEAALWQENRARAERRNHDMRTACSLWEDVAVQVSDGHYDLASHILSARKKKADENAHEQENKARSARDRLDALADGRLDMSAPLRAWLDRQGIIAKTLASHTGMGATERDRLFDVHPWLAHALVVDEGGYRTLRRLSAQADLSELGHAVFYLRLADVQQLLELTRSGANPLADKDGRQLVESLRTLEQAYLDDPENYEESLRRRRDEVEQKAQELHATAELLDSARGQVQGFVAFLEAVGMEPSATLADIVIRTKEKESIAAEMLGRRMSCEKRLGEAEGALIMARAKAEEAEQQAEEARARREAVGRLCELNDTCIRAKGDFDTAMQAQEEANRILEAAGLEVDFATERRQSCVEKHREAERESDAVVGLEERLRTLAPNDAEQGLQSSGLSETPCSSAELRVAIDELDKIVRGTNEELDRLRDKVEELSNQDRSEDLWRAALRGEVAGGFTLTKGEIEAWTPRDQAGRRALMRRRSELEKDANEAQERARNAESDTRLCEKTLEQWRARLLKLGLGSPLEVPDDYDFETRANQIRADEVADDRLLKELEKERRNIEGLQRRSETVAIRSSRDDPFRTTQEPTIPELEAASSWKPFVSSLEERYESCSGTYKGVQESLGTCARKASDAIRHVGEPGAARDIENVSHQLATVGRTKAAMLSVAASLEEQAQRLQAIAITLDNKLRITDEAIDDLVSQATDEAYQLVSELRRLVKVSEARVDGKRRQPTIRFRVRGHYAFQDGFSWGDGRRDEVATVRLQGFVREIVTHKLPSVEEARRTEQAKGHFAPHELVYQLVGERTVDVLYPVIRGGKGLTYETARDAGGSGSTGQKSAGYLLAFLSLLRYLGNSGLLSTEGSLFVALENQFGKISSSSIIRDIKAVVDQTGMQLITVAGRELASAYEMGDITYTLYRTNAASMGGGGSASLMRAQLRGSDQPISDAIIDSYRASRRLENLALDL